MQTATPSADLPDSASFFHADLSHHVPIDENTPPPVVIGDDRSEATTKRKQVRWYRQPIVWMDRFRNLSAMTISGLFHAMLVFGLACLALWKLPTGPRGLEIESLVVNAEASIPNFEISNPNSAVPSPQASEASTSATGSVALSSAQVVINEASQTTEAMSLAGDVPINVKISLESSAGESSTFAPRSGMFAHSSLDGRSSENRTKLALSRGGTQASEAAVEAALVWLTAHQHKDGGWSMLLQDPEGPCNGQCRHGTREELDGKRFAATGLALLTYLGAGYTHRDGKYRDQVYRGLVFLMDRIKLDQPSQADPRFMGQFAPVFSQHQMYEQGIASLALCEAYQMTDDKLLERYVQKAVGFIQGSQYYDGSWGYHPREPGDLSIVGWQMMSLKSASAGDVLIEPIRVQRVDGFLNTRQSAAGSKYSYRGPAPSRSMTAIGLLMRLYLGYPRTAPMFVAGSAYIAEKGPSQTDVYFNYYATQTLFQLEAIPWKQWNELLREYLINSQAKSGHEAGSWFFPDEMPGFNLTGGRLYTTSMSAMTLEVYYRYLPAYKDVREQPFKF
jgi:hypothetical protein